MEQNNVGNLRKAIGGGIMILSAIVCVVAIRLGGILGGIIAAIVCALLFQGAKVVNPQAGQKIFGNVKNGGAIALLFLVIVIIIVFIFASK